MHVLCLCFNGPFCKNPQLDKQHPQLEDEIDNKVTPM